MLTQRLREDADPGLGGPGTDAGTGAARVWRAVSKPGAGALPLPPGEGFGGAPSPGANGGIDWPAGVWPALSRPLEPGAAGGPEEGADAGGVACG